ncbi:uncharacterized protein LOC101457480 [Ceratitis capitata]|uniref:ZAD domain-containing protein n=1 Tax=Ceratitis capitata TaxID=7213 RepID=W8C0P2_CERCA|nr:uncharacterized protein LOC101457480 [Ceratitis capitata]
MSSWNNICRVCSSPAEYEIFEKIPAYLHASLNDFLHWQKPINVLVEETTGLKCSEDDGLPKKICALCISYLKHAVFFREQCINNSMSLKAAYLLHQKSQERKKNVDKDSVLITAQELTFTTEHQIDTNLLNTNNTQDQDKVCKQLLNNTLQTTAPTQQNIEQQMRYLNLLFNKDINAGLRDQSQNRRKDDAALDASNAAGDQYGKDECGTETSSENNDPAANGKNIFSYSEKSFQEDDIINLEEVGDAIRINIPESCKERKCRACFRRFMFEDSYNEHINTCIEYKFLTHIEEMNKLLQIRRSKESSPHEFVRRMIFAIRKTCEWLKEANCADMLLPDLVNNGNGADDKSKEILEAECKSSAATLCDQKRTKLQLIDNEELRKCYELPKNENMTDLLITKRSDSLTIITTTKPPDSTTEDNNLINKENTVRSRTPITISNNILYEIERSQSRTSKTVTNIEPEKKLVEKKPTALMGVVDSTNTKAAISSSLLKSETDIENVSFTLRDTAERLTFLQKLQQAASQSPKTSNTMQTTSEAASIHVRKDLSGPATTTNNQLPTSSSTTTPKSIPITPLHRSLSFSARCNPCNHIFETLAELEIHNAMYHNHMPLPLRKQTTSETQEEREAREAERQRIIALFENDDSEEDLD